jgi:hypothetical protein
MPSLPFDFEDLKNANAFDADRTVDTANKAADPTAAGTVGGPQAFLTKKLNQLRDNMNSTDGLLDLGLSINPVTRYTDMASKFFGGPGVQEGFTKGTTMTGDVRVPRMPF